MSFSTLPFAKRVSKPWGYELIYTPEGLAYTGKTLMIEKGKRISFQIHDQKVETLILTSGSALIWLEDGSGQIQKIPMELNKGYTVAVGQKHRVEALADSLIFEASLPETGTTTRIEDDYSRPDEDEALRQDPNRGWDK